MLKPCRGCGVPTKSGAICVQCERLNDKKRGRRQDRGYGREYQRNRKLLVDRAWANGEPCWLCGRPFAAKIDISADHVRPLARGGSGDLENLAPAHQGCNSARGDGPHPSALAG